jgi:hypothetical protein
VRWVPAGADFVSQYQDPTRVFVQHNQESLAGGGTSVNTTAFSAAAPFSFPPHRRHVGKTPATSSEYSMGLRVSPQTRATSIRYAASAPTAGASAVPALMSSTPFLPMDSYLRTHVALSADHRGRCTWSPSHAKRACALTARSARNGDRLRAAAQHGLGENLKPGTMAKMGLGQERLGGTATCVSKHAHCVEHGLPSHC